MKERKRIDNNVIRMLASTVAILLFAYCVFGVVSGFVFGLVEIRQLLKYFWAVIVCIMVPGVSICAPSYRRETIYFFCLSFLVGTAFDIVVYFLCAFWGALQWAYIIMPMVSAFLLFFRMARYRKKKYNGSEMLSEREEPLRTSIKTGIMVILSAYIILNIIAYGAGLKSPYINGITNVMQRNQDLYYWASNSAALKIQWPADYLFYSGLKLNYHYFSSIHVAWMSLVSRVDVFTCSSSLYAFIKSLTFFSAFYVFFNAKLFQNRVGIICLIIALFGNVFSYFNNVTYFGILSSPIGLDVGFAYCLIWISFFFQSRRTREKSDFGLTLLFWSMAVGSKAPIASILLLIPVLYLAHDIYSKDKSLVFFDLSQIVIFIIIAHFCVGVFSVLGMTGGGERGWFLRLQMPQGYQHGLVGESWKLGPLINAGYLVLCYPLLFMATIFAAGIRKSTSSIVKFEKMVLFFTLFIGIVLYLLIDAGNGAKNSRYFLYATYIVSWYLLVNNSDVFLERREVNRGIKFVFLLGSIAVLLAHAVGYWKVTGMGIDLIATYIPPVALLLIYTFRTMKQNQIFMKDLARLILGISLWCGVLYALLIRDYANYNTVELIHHNISESINKEVEYENEEELTTQDVEALAWIRDNTPPKSLVVDDVVLNDNWNRFFAFGVFCERQVFVDSTYMIDYGDYSEALKSNLEDRKQLMRELYNNDSEALNKIRDMGVNYIISQKDISPSFCPNEKICELVFENEEMRVFEIIR